MIRSMTSFARTESTEAQVTATVEIRSYNSRNLDPVIRLPHGYTPLEDRIKGLISDRITRGRVEVFVKVRDESEAAGLFEVDENTAASYCKALTTLRDRFGLQGEIPLELLARAGGIIKTVESERDTEAVWPVLERAVLEALDAADAMRRKEGDFIAEDFFRRLQFIESCVDGVEARAGDLLPLYRQRLSERIDQMTHGVVEIDPGRIAQEAALLADRSDISEEIVRARSHIRQFRQIMAGEEPAGRKLNFLLQEFNREFNTMAAKTGNAEISHTIVDVKAELEKLREQVQNVE